MLNVSALLWGKDILNLEVALTSNFFVRIGELAFSCGTFDVL